jgi:Protein of unknown function (DUF2480)
MENEIINKVAQSQLVTFDLEKFYVPGERVLIDIKDQLYQGMILKEKDFRDFIKATDWAIYKNKFVAINCSADAIVPTWAFMLLSIALQPHANKIVFGSLEDLENQIFLNALTSVDYNLYRDAKVVIKGCSKVNVPVSVYVEVTNRLRPVTSSIMFGEPCSTVPLYKRSKQ